MIVGGEIAVAELTGGARIRGEHRGLPARAVEIDQRKMCPVLHIRDCTYGDVDGAISDSGRFRTAPPNNALTISSSCGRVAKQDDVA
jgi:hypothetical protein